MSLLWLFSVIAPYLRTADFIADAKVWRDFLVNMESNPSLRRTTLKEQLNCYDAYPEPISDLPDYIEGFSGNSRVMLHKIVLDNLSQKANDMEAICYANDILAAFKALQHTRFAEPRAPRPINESLVKGFNEAYGDRHGLVSEYSMILRRHMNDWMTNRASWNAPYTTRQFFDVRKVSFLQTINQPRSRDILLPPSGGSIWISDVNFAMGLEGYCGPVQNHEGIRSRSGVARRARLH
jgi:hypothetical protein